MQAVEDHEIKCKHCYDTGVTVIELHQGNIEMLMLCNCDKGADETYQLLRWEMRVGGIATRKEFPVSWFKPTAQVGMWAKAAQWSAKIKVAEEYWQHQREGVGA